MSDDPFRPIAANSREPATEASEWTIVIPVPDQAPAPPAVHPTLGASAAIWRYADSAGRCLGYVQRYEKEGGKEFRPLTLWHTTAGNRLEWRWSSWPPKRPLYGLQGLAERPDAPVLIVEGEKAADAATRLLPGFVVVTSPNGSKSTGKADWSPLQARKVTIWPDHDEASALYAQAVAKAATRAGAASVVVVAPPPETAAGWDAADAEAEGWDEARASALLAAAVPIPSKVAAQASTTGHIGDDTSAATAATGAAKGDGANHRRKPQRDTLIGLTEFCELWHDPNRTAYASFPVNSHREHWCIRSREFRMWLSGRFYEQTGGAIGGQALEDGIRILEARAVNEGPRCERFTRIGYDGKLYVDLGDPTWRAAKITASGWEVIEKPPVKLLRSPSTRALPIPEPGYAIEELRRFVNVKSDADFMLVVAWIVAALRHRGPYPILVVNGEQGTGKSLFSRIIRSLVDPSAAPIRAVPRDDRDLLVSAGNSWVLAFDNLSSVPAWLADALCRLATGSGFATRMLHTDREETIFEAARPIIINGIPMLTERADLADRALMIHLRAIGEDERLPEDDLWSEFEQARPRILGALLDAVSRAMGNLDKVKIDRVPRMADFAKWITAAEPGLGWEPGAFLAAYTENRRDVSDAAFEADAVAVAIFNFVTAERPDGFEGTSTDLLRELDNRTPEGVRRARSWPQNATQLGNRVARATELLKAKGCIVERRHSGTRTITIVPPKRA